MASYLMFSTRAEQTPSLASTSTSSRARRLAGLAVLVLGGMAVALAGGCAPAEELTAIKDEAEFQRLVIEAKGPVMVEFSKDECPTCVVLEPEMVKVSKDYVGRVGFYKFTLMNRFFQPYAKALQDRYNLRLVPTVVLFVDGEEKQRWFMDYVGDDYRAALTEVVGPPRLSANQR